MIMETAHLSAPVQNLGNASWNRHSIEDLSGVCPRPRGARSCTLALFVRIHSRSLVWLALFGATLLLGLWLDADEKHAALFGLEGPPCLVGNTLGEKVCPGCGLSRSVALVLHGCWSQAFSVHPAGFLVVLLCIGGLILHADILRRGRRTSTHERVLSLGSRIFLAGLFASWLYRFL